MSEDRSLEDLEEQILSLKQLNERNGLDLEQEIAQLQEKLSQALEEKDKDVSDWERVKLARRPDRPTTREYLEFMMDDFYELHGDRVLGDDKALIGGLARFEGRTIVAIGQQKGGDAEESKRCNFGMPRPEGYRKAKRLMGLAEQFDFPLVSFVDTPGAYPGKESEQHNIGGTIARCIAKMMTVEIPTVALIVGEGGSGGAVAIAAADRVLIMENAIYSVISPEGCSSILWKSDEKAEEAAQALKLTAPNVVELGVADELVEEGPQGAHEDFETAASNLQGALSRNLNDLLSEERDNLAEKRRERYLSLGRYRHIDRDEFNPALE